MFPFSQPYPMTQAEIEQCVVVAKTRYPITAKTKIKVANQPLTAEQRADRDAFLESVKDAPVSAIQHGTTIALDVVRAGGFAFAYSADADILVVAPNDALAPIPEY